MRRNPALLIMDAGTGDTPVPPDAIVQPGETLEAFRDVPGYPVIKFKCVGVAPVGVPIEYAMADQAKPKQARPLMLAARKPHKETLYAFRMRRSRVVELFTHSQLTAARANCDAKRAAGEIPNTPHREA